MNSRRLVRLLLAPLLALAAAACAVTSPYTPPEIAAPDDWRTASEQAVAEGDVWWTALDDPMIGALIDLARERSPDAASAAARVSEARARRALSASALLPRVDANLSASTTDQGGAFGFGLGGRRELYTTSLDASWEADVFGRLRLGVLAADADLAAREADFDAVRLSLETETALAYIELRAFQRRLAIARANLETQGRTVELIEWRSEAGLVSPLDLERARANLETTRARIPVLRSGIDQSLNRLQTLTASPQGGLADLVAVPGTIPGRTLTLPARTPAEVLRQRPDIRASERALAAQAARLGIARADLYPSFRLTGAIGLESAEAGDLFDSDSVFDNLVGSVAAPIFRGGALRRQVDIQAALFDQAAAAYEQTVRLALEDVESTLSALAEERRRGTMLERGVAAARRAADLADLEYQSGLADFSAVLDAQRTLLTLEDELAASRAAEASAFVRLMKALGGSGMETRPVSPAP